MSAAECAPSTPDHSFNMDAAVTRLLALAANKRAARPEPKAPDGVTGIEAHLFTFADFPEPSADWHLADDALKAFADELVVIGGLDLMVEVYDEAAERHGYRAVCGVSASWDGHHGWWH